MWVRPDILRRNPPEVRVTSGQKPVTKIIYIVMKTSVGLFSISSKSNLILTTPNVENECWTSYETLKSSGEMKLMMKFCLCLHKISELWNLFSLVPMGNCFRCYFRQLFMYLAVRKCKNDCKILTISLVQILSTKTWNCSIFYRISSWVIFYCLTTPPSHVPK